MQGALPLTKYGTEIGTVFDLIGRTEVDLTAALAWVLAQSPALRSVLWSRLDMPGRPLQADLEVVGTAGRTDLELVGTKGSVIIEAKKGWLVPGEAQLAKYVSHFTTEGARKFVTLSDSHPAWSATHLDSHVADIPVVHLSWHEVRRDISLALSLTRHAAERLWLTQMATYLPTASAERAVNDQWVLSVVASVHRPGAADITFRQFVRDHRVYFHPYGAAAKNWPKRPPRFIAFRWDGKVQQVNRVTRRGVVTALAEEWPEIGWDDPAQNAPHVIYDLGPDIPLPQPIPSGVNYRASHVWVLLDQLLTSATLAEAVKTSKALTHTR